MAFTEFNWVDRVTANPNRRQITNTTDPSDVKIVDVARYEGAVTEAGTPLNASNLNNLEHRITAMNASLVGTPLTVTLPASGWQSNQTNKVYIQGVTATSNQEIMGLPATSPANIANNAALASANLQDYGQETDYITLYAANVPATDLQIRVIVRV